MHKPLWITAMALLLAPLVFSQVPTAAPPPLKGVQPQTHASNSSGPRAFGKPKLGPPKTGRKIANPYAVPHNAAIIAVLQRQKQAADAEAAQMKIGVHAAGQSQPAPGPAANSRNIAHPPNPNIQKTPAAGTIGPERVSGAPGNSPSSYSQLHPLDTTVLTCSHDTTMRILKVSGEAAPATFTPDVRYNFYTISGCSFGEPSSNAKVYIYEGNTFRQDFVVQEWHDNWIKLNLNPALSGVLEQDNLTLVVQRADGKQASKGGFKFYAARTNGKGEPIEVLLSRIPKQYFSLDAFRPDYAATSAWKADYTSPSTPSASPFLAGLTAEVTWAFPPHELSGNFDPYVLRSGDDYYDFRHMQPGFAPDSAWMEWVDIACDDGNLVADTKGKFDLEWTNDNRLRVFWTGEICKVHNGGFGVQSDDFQQSPGSMYGVNVWVTGPRCVDPWNGTPEPGCINDIKKQLGQ
ncbi:MAG: hypothetical protein LAN71_07615 [Acidobacteriia bacterium]|nr:hypothetical protein [Terriglobia bacterium]